jgi:GntR family transcriptional regulator/MocR family aminotransferase
VIYLILEKKPGDPLIRQIYEQLRNMILKGELRSGAKLPSSRAMAQHFNVSRNTVNEAYEMLIAEGYLDGVQRLGIFVARGAVLIPKPRKTTADEQYSAFAKEKIDEDAICFHSGTPAADLFPRSRWNRLAYAAFREAPESALGYGDPRGRVELREALAAYLHRRRGIVCSADNIIITTGAKQAISLTAKCLLEQGREVYIEDPTNRNVWKIFGYHTQSLYPIPVDGEGIIPSLLPAERNPTLIFCTPSHQFPLGGILSIQRRLELLSYAERKNCHIVEDDYDSEFRYRGLPVSSMQSLDPDRVIYIGTFSKILFPSLRLGYVVLPSPFLERFAECKMLGDHHTNAVNQLTLSRFLENGDLERHIARMKRIYRRRRDHLISCLRDAFGGRVTILGEGSGMHLTAGFRGVAFTPELLSALNRKGVIASAVWEHTANGSDHADKLILGYANLIPERIEEGIGRIKTVIDPLLHTHQDLSFL